MRAARVGEVDRAVPCRAASRVAKPGVMQGCVPSTVAPRAAAVKGVKESSSKEALARSSRGLWRRCGGQVFGVRASRHAKGGWHAPAAARERRAWFECNRALCGVPAAGRARSVKVHACPQARQVIFPRG